MATTLDPGLPRHRQLLNQVREMTPRDPREQPMRQHRPIYRDRHSRIMPPTGHDTSPAITHQLVRGLRSRSRKPLPHIEGHRTWKMADSCRYRTASSD